MRSATPCPPLLQTPLLRRRHPHVLTTSAVHFDARRRWSGRRCARRLLLLQLLDDAAGVGDVLRKKLRDTHYMNIGNA